MRYFGTAAEPQIADSDLRDHRLRGGGERPETPLSEGPLAHPPFGPARLAERAWRRVPFTSSMCQRSSIYVGWTRALPFKIKDARNEPVDVLWFVGDYASYDPRGHCHINRFTGYYLLLRRSWIQQIQRVSGPVQGGGRAFTCQL
jgi:hypothetical protein